MAALSNGVIFRRIEQGSDIATIVLRQISDFLQAGGVITNYISDTVDAFITISIKFPSPIILFANTNDSMSLTISDDLTGLDQFTATARGSIEV